VRPGADPSATLRFIMPDGRVSRVRAFESSAGRPGDDRRLVPASATHSSMASADAGDSLALVALYESTGGPNWTERTGWLAAPVAEWAGVSVSPAGRVTEVVLSANTLTGSLPAGLAGLDSLRVLDLSANTLSGSIPVEIGELQALVDLRLWQNALSGPLPDALGSLTALEELWLFGNAFSGSIPESLSQLERLRILYLDQNEFAGAIPASLGQLEQLTELFLDTNALSGPIPETLGQLTALQSLFLGNNPLEGPLPASFEQLVDLTVFSIPNVALNGTFPGAVYAMQSLNALYMGNTGIEGPLSLSLYDLPGLTRLHLEENGLTGEIPADIGFFNLNIRELVLRGNAFTGTLPASLGSLGLLELLDVSDNQLSGDLPAELGFAQRLRYLFLDENAFTGLIPDNLAGMRLLTQLGMADNRLSGPIPDWMGDFPLLNWLNLGLNVFSGFLPDRLGRAESLQVLSLWQNQFEGPIPASMGDLRDLQLLDLGSNAFSGPIPESLGNLPALLQVFLDTNELTGRIPEGLARQASLEVLALDNNRLDGAVPAGFNSLSQLVRLTMAGNAIEDLPVLTGMTGLAVLDVRSNRLTFEDLVPNAPIAAMLYAPQQQVTPVVDVMPAGTRIRVDVGGAGNTYQWYRAGIAIPDATTPTLLLSGLQGGAVIQCAVFNESLEDLVITSVPVTADVVLVRAVIVPDSVVVAPGDSVIFTAAGFDPVGTELRFTPIWNAGGGQIDSTGLFIAGLTPGRYEVGVEDAGGTVSATALVVINDPNVTGVDDESRPESSRLAGAYPNPFVDTATIVLELAHPTEVHLSVYDLLGRRVRAPWARSLPAGRHEVPFEGVDLPAGLYLYRVEFGAAVEAGTLLKVGR